MNHPWLFGMAHCPVWLSALPAAQHPTRPSPAPVRPCLSPGGQLGVCHAAMVGCGAVEMSVTVTVPFACLATPTWQGCMWHGRRLESMPKVPNPARPSFSPAVCRGLPGLQSARVCPNRAMSYCRVKAAFCTTQEIFAKTSRLTRRSFFPCSPNFSQVTDLCGPDARRRCSWSPDWWLASSDPSLDSFIFENHHPV